MIGIMSSVNYLRYIVEHKWYVFLACRKLGIPLRGIIHDCSKLLPDEWMSYCEYFYGDPKYQNKEAFNVAWLKHIHRNSHHWQYWVLRKDDGCCIAMEIPLVIIMEMVADWASFALKQGDIRNLGVWYNKNKHNQLIHIRSREFVNGFVNMLCTPVGKGKG